MKIVNNNWGKSLKQTLRNTIKKLDNVGTTARDKYSEIKSKAEPIIVESCNSIKNVCPPTKLEKLDSELKYLYKKYSKTVDALNNIKKCAPDNYYLIYKYQKDVELLNQEIAKVTEEYNAFVSKQNAAQEAFNRSNNF